ncbi:hypothetical protein C8R45DRAFT_1073453 [Mycena sanguinolenta]|nr:hypothetical protein C8R45DRAFT_1073453 [Mycena sanguinolenta]
MSHTALDALNHLTSSPLLLLGCFSDGGVLYADFLGSKLGDLVQKMSMKLMVAWGSLRRSVEAAASEAFYIGAEPSTRGYPQIPCFPEMPCVAFFCFLISGDKSGSAWRSWKLQARVPGIKQGLAILKATANLTT